MSQKRHSGDSDRSGIRRVDAVHATPSDGSEVRGRTRSRAAKQDETRIGLVRRARRMNRRLAEAFPHVYCELDFTTPLDLAVATILSAQCTDVRVNMVTPALFARYPTPGALAIAVPEDVEEIVRSTGFFRA